MTAQLAIVGVGNRLAGDDGVGIEVVGRLRRVLDGDTRVLFEQLPGDLLTVERLLDRAARFVFVDAVAGSTPGRIVVTRRAVRAHAASLHQLDIGAVMETLSRLDVADPFPPWEIWGVTIAPPRELSEQLSPPVAAAANELTIRLEVAIRSWLQGCRVDGLTNRRIDGLTEVEPPSESFES